MGIRRFLFGVGLTALFVSFGAAVAADNAVATERPRHVGPYIGLMAGYGLNEIAPADPAVTFDWAQSGAQGGVFVGSGTVIDGLYFGIEGDFALQDLRGEIADGIQVTSSSEWVATIRGRAGIPIGPALLYATAGLAVTDSKLSISGFGSDSETLLGLVLGAGIDIEVTRTTFVRLEATHTRWQDKNYDIGGTTLDTDQNGATAIRGAIGFKLN